MDATSSLNSAADLISDKPTSQPKQQQQQPAKNTPQLIKLEPKASRDNDDFPSLGAAAAGGSKKSAKKPEKEPSTVKQPPKPPPGFGAAAKASRADDDFPSLGGSSSKKSPGQTASGGSGPPPGFTSKKPGYIVLNISLPTAFLHPSMI